MAIRKCRARKKKQRVWTGSNLRGSRHGSKSAEAGKTLLYSLQCWCPEDARWWCALVFTVFEFRRARMSLRFYFAITADRLDAATRSNAGIIACVAFDGGGSQYQKQYGKEVSEIATIMVELETPRRRLFLLRPDVVSDIYLSYIARFLALYGRSFRNDYYLFLAKYIVRIFA